MIQYISIMIVISSKTATAGQVRQSPAGTALAGWPKKKQKKGKKMTIKRLSAPVASDLLLLLLLLLLLQ